MHRGRRRQLFARADRNGDKSLSHRELKRLLKEHNVREQMNIGSDSDKVMPWVDFWKKVRRGTRRLVLCPSFTRRNRGPSHAHSTFALAHAQIDMNGDGKLDLAEFQAFMRRNVNIARIVLADPTRVPEEEPEPLEELDPATSDRLAAEVSAIPPNRNRCNRCR